MYSETKITVRYAETDQMGIAHHANYPIWYEAGRTDFIKQFGVSYTEMEQSGIMTPLLNLHCHYGLPAFYEDELVIRTKLIRLTPARIVFAYTVCRLERDGTETHLGTGETEHAIIDKQTFRPCNFKKRMPQLYEKFTEAMEE